MSTAGAVSSTLPSGESSAQNSKGWFAVKLIGFAAILALATGFVLKYVFRYYLHYNQAAFTDPMLGAGNYWAMRLWLLMHITGGMVALLTGPWQFWTGFRARYAGLHRLMGKIYLSAVAIGSIGSVRMAIGTTGNWATSTWEIALALAWVSTTGMAYYSILKGFVPIHKDWMVRSYVVTFAFVTFRLLNDYGPLSRLQPASDRGITIGWACWAVPLLIAEVLLQLRKMQVPAKS
jgi:hypothetical protein